MKTLAANFLLSVRLFCVILLSGITLLATAQNGEWTYKTPMPTGRGFTSGSVVDGKIYVIGGFPTHYSVTGANEMYDPSTDKWTVMKPMPEGRCEHATCAYNGKIYVFGGLHPDPYSNAKNNVYVYDPQTDSWTQKANMPYENAICGVAVVNDTIYLIGGMLNFAAVPVSRLMAYDPLTDTWSEKAPMPTPRGWFSASVVDGKIYAIGGTNEDYHNIKYKLVEVYDPLTNTWTTKADMPTGRTGLATCTLNGKIYAVGGYSHPTTLSEGLTYDPISDRWTKITSLQTKRHTCFLASVNNKIYAIAGSYPEGSEPVILNSVEEYNLLATGNKTRFGDQQNNNQIKLDQNYPNPFNSVTTIPYELFHQNNVRISVFDLLGREVKTLVNKKQSAGKYQVTFSGDKLEGGIYFYQMQAKSEKGNFTDTKKLTLIK